MPKEVIFCPETSTPSGPLPSGVGRYSSLPDPPPSLVLRVCLLVHAAMCPFVDVVALYALRSMVLLLCTFLALLLLISTPCTCGVYWHNPCFWSRTSCGLHLLLKSCKTLPYCWLASFFIVNLLCIWCLLQYFCCIGRDFVLPHYNLWFVWLWFNGFLAMCALVLVCIFMFAF